MAGSSWKLRYAPNIGLNSLDTPMFRHGVGDCDPIRHVHHIADLGFAGIEDNFLKLRPPAQQSLIGQALRERGLRMGCFVSNPERWSRPLWVSSSPEARALLDSDLDSAIAAAERTGGRVMTLLTGADPSVPRSYQVAAMIDNLRRLAPRAVLAGGRPRR